MSAATASTCTVQGHDTPAVVFDAALGALIPELEPRRAGRGRYHSRVRRTTARASGGATRGPLPRTAGRIADELHELLRRAAVSAEHRGCSSAIRMADSGDAPARGRAIRDNMAGLVLIEPAHPEEWMQPSDAQRTADCARGARLCRYGAQRRAAWSRQSRGGTRERWRNWNGVGHRQDREPGGLGRADENILAPVWKLPPAITAAC